MTYTSEDSALIHRALSYYSAQLDSDLHDEFGDHEDVQETLTATNNLLDRMEG